MMIVTRPAQPHYMIEITLAIDLKVVFLTYDANSSE